MMAQKYVAFCQHIRTGHSEEGVEASLRIDRLVKALINMCMALPNAGDYKK